MTEELKPCPFCGGEVGDTFTDRLNGSRTWVIGCINNNCRVNPITDSFHDKNLAIIVWNNRVEVVK